MEEEKLRLRAKASAHGMESLSDAEVLALVIGEGRATAPPLEQAEHLLSAFQGNLTRLCHDELSHLRMVASLGLRRAERIAAAAELSRRLRIAEGDAMRTIRDSHDVAELFAPLLAGLRYEECWAVYLSSSNGVLARQRISQGGVQRTVVDTRIVVRRALELLCSRLILVHNHPSGSPTPSEEDLLLTRQLSQAAALFDIALLDHLIITREKVFSFLDSGLLT